MEPLKQEVAAFRKCKNVRPIHSALNLKPHSLFTQVAILDNTRVLLPGYNLGVSLPSFPSYGKSRNQCLKYTIDVSIFFSIIP